MNQVDGGIDGSANRAAAGRDGHVKISAVFTFGRFPDAGRRVRPGAAAQGQGSCDPYSQFFHENPP